MFWLICGAMTLIVALAIFAPIWRGRGQRRAEPAAAFDLQVYRDQLREVERDLERDVINAEDAQRLRTEIGRKVLDADRRLGASVQGGRGGGVILGGIILVLVLGAAAPLYLREGVPGAEDLPLAKRVADAQRAYDQRPSQADAEAKAKAENEARQAKAIPVDEDYVKLVQQLREAVAKKPDDPQGLTLLATNEMRMGNMLAAREAQQRLVDLRGEKADAAELMRLAALMMESAGGIITPEGEEVLARSLRKDPGQPQARYLLGLLQLQNGRPDRAFPIWSRLLEEGGPADAPWLVPIRATIPELAWIAGHPDYTPPEPDPHTAPAPVMPGTAMPGPDAETMAAAQDMSDDERQDMIAGMVGRLEDRLASEGGTPEEWARLISSLVVIGKTDHARDIWTEAKTRFAQNAPALAMVNEAASNSGLSE